VKVVSDAGPLLALAKVDGLSALFRLFPQILIPPAVHEETVVAGQRLGAPDAVLLEACCNDRRLDLAVPSSPSFPLLQGLGRGEEESIRLAIERRAEWLLIDDYDARQAALSSFRAAGVGTGIKGTLGVLVSAHQKGHLSQREAIERVNALSQRLDVWISQDLCRHVIEILGRSSR
jgi:predicted nucleic acid-binding protein